MSARSLCCLFHLCCVALLWYEDFIFVIAVICMFLYAGCLYKVLTLFFGFFFLLCLGSFWIVIDVFCSLLIQLVSVFRAVLLCAVCVSVSLEVVVDCSITDASLLHPHEVRKIPSAGNQCSPAAVRDAFGLSFSLHPPKNCNLHVL